MNERPDARPLLSPRRWLVACGLGLYLYFLLPATAVMFYELYHFTSIDPVYWGYSAFKAAGYYFGIWEYRVPTCIGVALLIGLLPSLIGLSRRG